MSSTGNAATTKKLVEESKDQDDCSQAEQEWNTEVKNYVFEESDGKSQTVPVKHVAPDNHHEHQGGQTDSISKRLSNRPSVIKEMVEEENDQK